MAEEERNDPRVIELKERLFPFLESLKSLSKTEWAEIFYDLDEEHLCFFEDELTPKVNAKLRLRVRESKKDKKKKQEAKYQDIYTRMKDSEIQMKLNLSFDFQAITPYMPEVGLNHLLLESINNLKASLLVNYFAVYQIGRQMLNALAWWSRNASRIFKKKWVWLKNKMHKLGFKSNHGELSERLVKYYVDYAVMMDTYPRLRLVTGVTFSDIYHNMGNIEELIIQEKPYWKKSFTSGFTLSINSFDEEGQKVEHKLFPVIQLEAKMDDFRQFKVLYDEHKKIVGDRTKDEETEDKEVAFETQLEEYMTLFKLLNQTSTVFDEQTVDGKKRAREEEVMEEGRWETTATQLPIAVVEKLMSITDEERRAVKRAKGAESDGRIPMDMDKLTPKQVEEQFAGLLCTLARCVNQIKTHELDFTETDTQMKWEQINEAHLNGYEGVSLDDMKEMDDFAQAVLRNIE